MVAFEAWAFLGTIALVITLIWAVGERRITLMTLLSAVLWVWWGLQATSISYYRNATEYTESYPVLVYVGAFLGLVSLLALILHRLDQYPPDSEESRDTDREGTTT